LIVESLITALVIVVGGVCSQPALGTSLTAVPDFLKSFDSHRIGSMAVPDDNTADIFKSTAQVSPGQTGEIIYHINVKLRVGDAVFLFQLA